MTEIKTSTIEFLNEHNQFAIATVKFAIEDLNAICNDSRTDSRIREHLKRISDRLNKTNIQVLVTRYAN